MDRTDSDKCPDKAIRDEDQVFCPNCASELRLTIDILDTRRGKTYRIFRCACGEYVWDD